MTLGHILKMLCMPANPIVLAPNESLTHQVGTYKDGKQLCARCGKILSLKPLGPWTENLFLTERRTTSWTEWKVERRRDNRSTAAPHAKFGE
jgi:hypothetical protein